jgi:hypothetical protein
MLFTVVGRGEEKRCFSCTRTGADSFCQYGGRAGWRDTVFLCHTHRSQLFLVWWQGGVERNRVSLPHALEQIVLSMVAGRGGEKRCFSRTRTGGHSILV